ncbi:MAG: hypothetical protein V3V14_10360 [Saprospiraceae bacterium]
MKSILTLMFFAFFVSMGFSQPNADRIEKRAKIEEKIKQKRIAFITMNLDFTQEEAQRFWPVYNEFEQKRKAIMMQKIKLPFMHQNEMTELEADQLLTNIIKIESEELALKNEYIEKLKTVIPTVKVAQLVILEKRFRQEILNKFKHKMKGRRGPR